MRTPRTWGEFLLSAVALVVVLFAAWGFANLADRFTPWHGGKVLAVVALLLVIGGALFGSRRTFDAMFGGDDEGS